MDWDFEWEFGPGGFLRGLWRVLTALATMFGALILLLLFVAVAVLLIRYLLVATKAAQLYVDAHTPDRPDTGAIGDSTGGPTAPTGGTASASGTTAAGDSTTAASTDATATKPARTPRAPRTPRTPSTS